MKWKRVKKAALNENGLNAKLSRCGPLFMTHHHIVVQLLSAVRIFATAWTAGPPGFPVLHQLLEFAQTHVYWVDDDAIQPSHSQLLPTPPAPQSFPTSGPFPMSRLVSRGQSIGASASASVLPMNIQDWFPLGLTGFISLLSKGLSRVFSSTTVQKPQFFSSSLFLWSSSHVHTWLLEKP